jgi:hypothetical protein
MSNNQMIQVQQLSIGKQGNPKVQNQMQGHEHHNLKEMQQHQPHHHNDHNQQGQDNQDSHGYNVTLRYNPTIPNAGTPTQITISIKEKRTGRPLAGFERVHDKLMHMIIVGEDLSYFAHIHPTLEADTGNFSITNNFPEADNYKIWVDFKPKGGIQSLVTFKLDNMIGAPHKPIPLTGDIQSSTIEVDEKYQVKMASPIEMAANTAVDIVFEVSDAEGNPITDLEPLMGAGGHVVIISSDRNEFLHVHPTQEVSPDWNGGPKVSFSTSFPKPGIYKAWGQFQHNRRTVTADFILNVK